MVVHGTMSAVNHGTGKEVATMVRRIVALIVVLALMALPSAVALAQDSIVWGD